MPQSFKAAEHYQYQNIKGQGHADMADTIKGNIKHVDRIRNHAADAIAAAAHAIVHPSLIHIVKFAANRQRKYAIFLHVSRRFGVFLAAFLGLLGVF